jgi:hypothetical protein
MKIIALIPVALLLSACSATMVSYSSGAGQSTCPPVVSVHSIGGSVTVTDGTECRAVKK